MKARQQELLRARSSNPEFDLVISDCEAGVWIVVHKGQPIQIRRDHLYKEEKKYLPNCWSQRGSAERQAQQLNKLFHTTDFEIAQILGKTPD